MDPLEELIRAQPGLSLMLAALGLVVGSFLNVVIHRLPKIMEAQWARDCAEYRDEPLPSEEPLSLAYPGSQCPHCNTKIRAWQNIPVVSYLVLRGRCARLMLLEFDRTFNSYLFVLFPFLPSILF